MILFTTETRVRSRLVGVTLKSVILAWGELGCSRKVALEAVKLLGETVVVELKISRVVKVEAAPKRRGKKAAR